jgi:hypothetical protein
MYKTTLFSPNISFSNVFFFPSLLLRIYEERKNLIRFYLDLFYLNNQITERTTNKQQHWNLLQHLFSYIMQPQKLTKNSTKPLQHSKESKKDKFSNDTSIQPKHTEFHIYVQQQDMLHQKLRYAQRFSTKICMIHNGKQTML